MRLKECSFLLLSFATVADSALIPRSGQQSTTSLTQVYHTSTEIILFQGTGRFTSITSTTSSESTYTYIVNPVSKGNFTTKPLTDPIAIESITRGTTIACLNYTTTALEVLLHRRDTTSSEFSTSFATDTSNNTVETTVFKTSTDTVACIECIEKSNSAAASILSSSDSSSTETSAIPLEKTTLGIVTNTVACSETTTSVLTETSINIAETTVFETSEATIAHSESPRLVFSYVNIKETTLNETGTVTVPCTKCLEEASTSLLTSCTAKSTIDRYTLSQSQVDGTTESFYTTLSTTVGTNTFTTNPISFSESTAGTSLVTSFPVTSTLSATSTALASSSSSGLTYSNGYEGDLFVMISDDATSDIFTREDLPLELPSCVSNNGSPFQTNKFYVNLFLGSQDTPIYVSPYNLNYIDTKGIGIQNNNISKRVFGTEETNNPEYASYYYNPIYLEQLIFTSSSFSNSVSMCVNTMKVNSVNIQLSADYDAINYIEFPIVQGMGFVTSIYHGNLIPKISTLTGIQELAYYGKVADTIDRYSVTLSDYTTWLIYVSHTSASDTFSLYVGSDAGVFYIEGTEPGNGVIIQVAIAPSESLLISIYDQSAGIYVTEASIFGESYDSGTYAEYGFHYSTIGSSLSNEPLVFIFPHVNDSLVSPTSSTGLILASATKGYMTGYLSSTFIMGEDLETNIQFLPWSEQITTSDLEYSMDQLKLIAAAANDELLVDIADVVAAQDSIYFSGKVLDKYAYVLLVLEEIIGDESLTKTTLKAIQGAFEIFTTNEQYYPFIYDTKFGGVTSSASQGGDTGADFGSGYYNDHHFHYGYFVHAAAIVGYVDNLHGGTWVEDNKWWVNSLIRDVANPSEDDTYFPVSRMLDWYSGHSWAAGLFESGDGRNQESSLEDYNFAYGMKLWGRVQGDSLMESRGDLMLSIMKRSMSCYYLFKDENQIEPSQYIGNKVAGILFENKLAYTTYFGEPDLYPEYVHGIHMLPITPASSRIRDASFVQQEWKEQISEFVGNVDTEWLGILMLNKALYDPASSYEFFSDSSFRTLYLDDGMSLTWSLAFSGGLMNSI